MVDFITSLREMGLNLTPGKNYSDEWMEYKRENIGYLEVVQKIPPHVFSGYESGYHQQTVGTSGVGVTTDEGIVIEITDNSNPKRPLIYSEQVLENTDFTTQQAFWRKIVEEIHRLMFPQTSYKGIGTLPMQNPLNPAGHEWEVGDVVNVSRLEQSGGGLALGHVARIYPTEVLVMWKPDALHPSEWTTTEKKTALIFVKHDPNWVAEHEYKAESTRFSSENYTHFLYNPRSTTTVENEIVIENEMSQKPPAWTQNVTPIGAELFHQNPMPFAEDIWGEQDSIMDYTNTIIAGAVNALSFPELTSKKLSTSNTIAGFQPYTGLSRTE